MSRYNTDTLVPAEHADTDIAQVSKVAGEQPAQLNFVVKNIVEFKILSRPHVYKTANESIISCLFHQITVFNKTYDCPHYPFRIPLETLYSLDNTEHQVTFETVRVAEKEIRYKTPHFFQQPAESEFYPVIKDLIERNRHSVASGKFSVDKSTLSIPLDTAGCLAIILGLIFISDLGACSTKFCCKSEASAPVQNTRVSVNTREKNDEDSEAPVKPRRLKSITTPIRSNIKSSEPASHLTRAADPNSTELDREDQESLGSWDSMV